MKITVGKASSRSTAAELAASEEIVEKALLTRVTLDMVETPLQDFVEQLARQLDINVLVDHKALSDVGIDPTTPVTCKVTNLPLRCVLKELLRALDLTWIIQDGSLVVTTPEEAETGLTTTVYDVSSLLVSSPDYPASRSNDLGDLDPLFGPTAGRFDRGALDTPGFSGSVIGMGIPSVGMGMTNVSGEPSSPPILRQNAAPSGGRAVRPAQPAPQRYGSGSPLDFDSLIDSITSTIQPTVWDCAGGPCSITAFPPQQLLAVNATGDVHEQVAAFLDTLRHRVETRPQVRIEAHWLWLTEPELATLLAGPDQASPAAGDVVAEAAWKKLRQQKRDDADNAAGDLVEMGAFEVILKGQSGQLISGVSGRQTRVLTTLIPVVGDPPVTGGGMGGTGPAPATPQTPAPPAQTAVVAPAAGTYTSHPSEVGYQPVCRTIQEGGALEVRPCVVAGGKEILLDLRSRFVRREDNPDARPQTPAAGAAANAIQAVAAAVDRPQIHHYRLETTLRVPAGRRVLVGGLTYSEPSADQCNLYLFVKATVVGGPSQTDR
jgi:hypothetical protein